MNCRILGTWGIKRFYFFETHRQTFNKNINMPKIKKLLKMVVKPARLHFARTARALRDATCVRASYGPPISRARSARRKKGTITWAQRAQREPQGYAGLTIAPRAARSPCCLKKELCSLTRRYLCVSLSCQAGKTYALCIPPRTRGVARCCLGSRAQRRNAPETYFGYNVRQVKRGAGLTGDSSMREH